MKKFLGLTLAALFALGLFTSPILAQVAVGPESTGFAFATDYGKWSAVSNGDVAAGAVVVTLKDPNMGTQVTQSGRQFRPFATNASVKIDAGGANPETLTPSAVSCAQGALTCSFTVTTSYAHSGNFTIQSGTFGLAEAYNAILATNSAKGTVFIANGWGGSTSTITGFTGSSSVNVLDARIGSFQFYTSSGGAYAASVSPFNTTAASATLTTAVGAPFSLNSLAVQTTNYGIVNVATGANADGATSALVKTRSTAAGAPSTTTIVSGDDLGTIKAFGADGTNYIETAKILFDSTGTVAATRVPSVIKFFTGTDAAPTVETLALTLGADQSANFAGVIQGGNIQSTPTALDATVTTQAPSPRAAFTSAPGTNAELALAATGASTTANQLVALKTRATTAGAPATATVVTGDSELAIRAFGADGTNYIESAAITFNSTGTVAATRVPGTIVFRTGTDAAPTVLTTALTLGADQTATFVGQINSPSAINASAGALALKTTTSGNITLTPAAAATAAVTVPSTRFETAKGATVDSAGASCTSGDCTLGGDGNFFIISNTTTVDGFATAGWQAGSVIVIQTSGSITFNNNGTVAGGFAAMKLVGGANVSMTADDNMILIYTGSFWDQIAPTLVK